MMVVIRCAGHALLVQSMPVGVDDAGRLQNLGDDKLQLRIGRTAGNLLGDLHGLCRGNVPGRQTWNEITMSKSVAADLEDLATARMFVATSGDKN